MKSLHTAILLCTAALLATPLMAQDTTPPPPPQGQTQGPPPGGGWGGGRGPRGGSPEERLERMQKFLKLSDDQTAQIKTIMADERTKMEALRSNGAAPRDNRAQMMAIHQDGETRIHALLTPDQQKKYDDMQARMRERMEERGGRGGTGGPGGDTPPPPPPPPAPSQQ